MADPFRSARLLYRAIESPGDDALFHEVMSDPVAHQNSDARAPVPQSKKLAAEHQRYFAEEAMLGVVICLAPLAQVPGGPPPSTPPTPIGVMHLGKAYIPHHRHTDIGINILRAWQGQGYGSEAIRWVLGWAFEAAGLHRVQIRCFEYNDGARRLYERLGFTPEGRWREHVWHRGRFWDDLQFGMLDREWRAMQEREREQEGEEGSA